MGVIGCGGMAQSHMRYFQDVRGLKFTAASDTHGPNLQKVVQTYGVKGFDDGTALLESGLVDAVLIGTPHYFHPTYAAAALERGVHVMSEKPVAVTAKAAARVNEVHAEHPDLMYGVMYQYRAVPRWRTMKDLIASGRIGNILRVHWTATNWFRTQAYYDSGGWRATWKGEGGGVLLNQCPHNIDVMYWLFGLPRRIRAFVGIGRYHRIEVEDDVTAVFEYENGATGVFITSTGEYPGSNAMEVVGDLGRIQLAPTGPIECITLDQSSRRFSDQDPSRMGAGPQQTRTLIEPPEGGIHRNVMQGFIDAILHQDASRIFAPGDEGLHSVEMINAMIMSGLTGKPVDLPTDRDGYEKLLQDLIAQSEAKNTRASA